MTASVVVGVDPHRPNPEAAALGVVLARAERAPLVLIAVFGVDRLFTSTQMREAAREQAERALHEAAERLVDQGHLSRGGSGVAVVDPLLAEWLRRR